MEKEVYKKDAVVRDDLSSWFICRKMEGGELLLTLKSVIKDKPITASSQTEDYIPGRVVKRAGKKIHDAGGCDAKDDYSRGYDDAVTLALDILLEETGYVMEDFLDYEENKETENP